MEVLRTKTVEQSVQDAEDSERGLRRTLGPVGDPILSVLASLWLMLNLQSTTWIRFGIWMVAGLVVYFGYSVRHSRLARGEPRLPDTWDHPATPAR